MPDFIIEVYELHSQKYRVEGVSSKEEAIQIYEDGEAEFVDNAIEYIEPAELYSRDGLPPAIRSVEEV